MRWYSKLLLFIRTAYWWWKNRRFLLWSFRTINYEIEFAVYTLRSFSTIEKIVEIKTFEVDSHDHAAQLRRHYLMNSFYIMSNYAVVF